MKLLLAALLACIAVVTISEAALAQTSLIVKKPASAVPLLVFMLAPRSIRADPGSS